jgi:hypothetical protein
MLDQRARLLRAALGFLAVQPREPEVQLLHRWLDSWPGIGHIVAGMARQGYDLELRRYDGQGWRAMFFPEGFEHSLTAHAGAAWALSPWQAVQQAASDALRRLEVGEPGPHDWTLKDDSPR